ncbi:MAG TPA: hypothetical protein PK228_08930, partial [Saprospiraceae bacterium]|nr:hypothetical protein [Saprospiraceae bacterium]
MKIEPNHIDDIFRQRLYDTEVAPPAFVWPHVERELQKRKRRLFFLWLFAFGIVGTGLWAMYNRYAATTLDVAATQVQQGNAENKNETATAAELQQAQDGSTTDLSAGIVAEPPLQEMTAKSRISNDGKKPATGITDLEFVFLPGAVPDALSKPEQSAQTWSDFKGFSPLQSTVTEPLEHSGKVNLPQARLFIRKKKDPKYCYDFTGNPNVWMIDAYAGPSFSKRSLEATDPASEQYAQMRRATEQTDWSFNAGLRGTLLLGRHFLVRTGLHYEQKTEVFEYADPNYIKYIVEIINQPGEPTIIDTVDIEYGENYVKTYNRYGFLDIPLEIGGEIRRGRFGLSINAGTSFNVLFWKHGTILSPDGQPEPFTPGEKGATEVYRPRTGWSATGSAQLFFHLQPTLRVFAEPYYRQILKPVTLDDQPVEQRYSNWGLKI